MIRKKYSRHTGLKRNWFIEKSILTVLILILLQSSSFSQDNSVFISDLSQRFIANEFGPPEKDQSFDKHKLSIRGREFDKGLGVHAPSKISIGLNGNGSKFYASIGIDDAIVRLREDTIRKPAAYPAHYVYDGNQDLRDYKQGGTVRFRVIGDGKILFSSGWISENSQAQDIEVNIESINKLSLEVDKGIDGSFGDYADWADARVTLKNKDEVANLKVYGNLPDILLNQTGFIPASFKTFRTAESGGTKEFSVIDMSTNKPVFTGEVTEKQGDWGKVFIGDFSTVTKPGKYYVQFGNRTSSTFSIEELQYVYNLKKHMNWFWMQRCGDPLAGWDKGCHMDDGVRKDNGKYQDVSGGWHDAADVRKWGMTINGLWALTEIYLSLSSEKLADFDGKKELITRIKDEIDWGNKHYLKMQEPQGYLMNHVGGDVYSHADNNRFTDNIPANADDRIIDTKPRGAVFQYMFVISQCNIALVDNPENRKVEMQKAEKCFQWADENKIVDDIHSLGAAQVASLKLYEVTGDEKYLKQAEEYLRIILGRQDTNSEPVKGFIRAWKPGQADSENNFYPQRERYLLTTPNFPVWSIVESIKDIKNPDLNKEARDAFQMYVDHYIKYFDEISSYGIVPMALYTKEPGGNRKVGSHYYRWCYSNSEDKSTDWNGINPIIGYAGAALVRGGTMLNDKDAIRIGQQQLDFIYGCNPFNASTVTGLGYNQPDFFKTFEYKPATPELVGAVMAGIGSSKQDLPVLAPGWWQSTEYWMEAVTGTIMLLNELNIYQFDPNNNL